MPVFEYLSKPFSVSACPNFRRLAAASPPRIDSIG
jgi:hypothetical protein